MLAHGLHNGFLVAHLQVKVDNFVREGGELIAEAEGVDALEVGLPRETVILLLHVLVQHLTIGGRQLHVHIVVTSHYNLNKDIDLSNVNLKLQ